MIKIGTCGFRLNKLEYAEKLSCVEVQHTFYQPPQIKTLEGWAEQMPPGFEFTLKAWQLITHEGSSPTYRRVRRALTDKESTEAGSFKLNDTVLGAWETTRDSANALGARTVLFQCPARFSQTTENIENLYAFFEHIDRGGMNCCWEPRGPWADETITAICSDLDLWHVVDPFVRRTVTPDRCYFRLHGIGGWRYKYEDAELEELIDLLSDSPLSYIFFNNNEMIDDAVRFEKLVRDAKFH